MRPQWAECTECMVARMSWFEAIHEIDTLAQLDVITEADWRAEFAAWVQEQS
jgi:antitoxin component of MazEF toxin-antitoxin module